ncbi:selenium-dependent molybdenum cofactor biosynthesis protein YqeB [Haloimpatiens sp. FM7330]|uniref:selenium-dependent molybdenum cofactor biosynthesis protein YqeB n=1 Tax=Haloimpatiens sp. FM7330 TaxID=3298610 RepID=UPI0036357779
MLDEVVVVRGGGDIASGTIQKLHRSGFKVLVLDVKKPTSIRRKVCFSEAIYEKQVIIEDIKAVCVDNADDVKKAWKDGSIPVVVDPQGKYIEFLKPEIVIDAILAKKNLGTNKDMAQITIALGPGFEAGKDVDIVIETMRGHNLGRLIFKGRAMNNTGIPGNINGYSKERVLYSPSDGIIKNICEIGDKVKMGDVIAYVEKIEVKALINGVLRGIIRDEIKVFKGMKIGDIDPRITEEKNCFTISDKARNIAGGVLEAILYLKHKKFNK